MGIDRLAFHLFPNKARKAQLEGLLYRHIRIEFFYQLDLTYSFFHYSTRGGARVPIAIDSGRGILGFIVLNGEAPTRSDIASAHSFLKTFNNSKIIFVSEDIKIAILADRMIQLPICLFL